LIVSFHEQAKFEGDLYAGRVKEQYQFDKAGAEVTKLISNQRLLTSSPTIEFARNDKWLLGRRKRPHGARIAAHGTADVPHRAQNGRTDGWIVRTD
jgi:hypothetical protein